MAVTDSPPTAGAGSAGRPAEVVDVALVGLGTLGLKVARNLIEDTGRFRLVAAIEGHDTSKHGRDVGELAGTGPCGVQIAASLPADVRPAAAIVVTYSRLSAVEATIHELVERGVNVVTSAEELGYPWHEFPAQSRRIDELARRQGVSVLGVGANPGFIMDALPTVMSLACRGIRSIEISRTLDLTHQREHKLARLGVGIDAFEPGSDPGIVGHLGYRQSIDMLADALGWRLDAIEEDPVTPEVLAASAREGAQWTIPAGKVAIVRHSARGLRAGEPLIELRGYYGFILEQDPIAKGDTFRIAGDEQSFEVSYRPGMVSSATTPAILMNLTHPTIHAEPGLRTSLDFRIGEFTSVGL
jgi:4-hydroxy-tetrahydrodipicolinate reductase